jgi:HD superfamily phosphohydrolase YqeK
MVLPLIACLTGLFAIGRSRRLGMTIARVTGIAHACCREFDGSKLLPARNGMDQICSERRRKNANPFHRHPAGST